MNWQPIKAYKAEDGTITIEGYGLVFTDAEHPDLTGEYFAKDTNLFRTPDQLVGTPILYHHALDETLKARQIGSVVKAEITDTGLWLRAQLDLHDEYNRAIESLIEDGVLGFSSGALPQTVDIEEDGKIKAWMPVEFSLTPSPAQPVLTQVKTQSKEADIAITKQSNSQLIGADTSQTIYIKQGTKTMDMEKARVLLNELLALMGETADVEEESMMAGEIAKMDEPETEDEMKALVKSAFDALDQARANKQAKRDALKASVQAEQATRKANAKPEFKSASAPRVEMTDLRYGHMKTMDMAMAAVLMKKAGVAPSADYMRVLQHRAMNYEWQRPGDREDFKSYFKANEMDTSTYSTQGSDWVSVFYSQTLWEKVRANLVYQELISRGMEEYEIPQGAGSVDILAEGADPTLYSAPQLDDLDATGRPPVVASVTPFGTAKVSLSAGQLLASSVYTKILEEDSLIPVMPQLSSKFTKIMAEGAERLLVNGDTATGANTNINLIDGTPATGITTPYYIATNGWRKYPLVTNTALSRDASTTFDLSDYDDTYALFSPEFAQNQSLVWLVDHYTYLKTLRFTEVRTFDVTGDQTYTVRSGKVSEINGVPLFSSAFLPKTNTAGKVSATPGNNTKGTILLIYAPYWAIGYKRNVTIEFQYDAMAQATAVVGSMRMGMVARGAEAAAASYNVAI